MIKVWVVLALLSLAFLGCTVSQECPSGWFDVSFAITIDTTISRELLFESDAELHYFRETLKLTNEETEQVTQDALEFYNMTYGLDFFNSPLDAGGRRQFENATMIPFEVPFNVPVTHNRWVINGRKGINRCFYMREGGYNVRFTGNQVLRGTYGGKEGRFLLAESVEGISYVLFSLNVCPHQPNSFILTCKAPTPTFRNPDFYAVRLGDCYNRELGHGLVQGAQGTIPTDDPNTIRLITRMVMNFPSHPDPLP